jgi:hypothetical protein
MQQCYDQYWFRFCAVNNEVGVDRPEEHVLFGEILTSVTHSWHSGDLAEGPIESLQHTIGGFSTVFSNKIPDFLKVATGLLSENEPLQLCCRRRSALWALSCRNASSPSMVSPRSA